MLREEIRPVEYVYRDTTFEGLFLTAPDLNRKPTILVCHGWEGRIDSLIDVAKRLLSCGYQAFLVDLYGKGITGDTPDECSALMQPLLDDREELAQRLGCAVAKVTTIPEVNGRALGAIGFCFGGLCVLDLARIGAPVKGVASFHGVFAPRPSSPEKPIQSKIAIYHGWDDPMAPPEDVVSVCNELTEADADWQLLAFSQTMHAFMSEEANSPEMGIQANPRSAKRAWTALEHFLKECF